MQLSAGFVDDLPELDPVIAREITEYGWRGLTAHGEVLEVKSSNGDAIAVPDEITVWLRGQPIGRRRVSNHRPLNIDEYLTHFNRVVGLYRDNRIDEALSAAEAAIAVAPTLRARFNRAMVLLAAGHWQEGFAEYLECEQHAPFMRPQARVALESGFEPWRGEDLRGKRLLLLHAHGFGDTLMMLRYLPQLAAMGIDVGIETPPELRSLTRSWRPAGEFDYVCPILHLLHFLKVTPESVDGAPYLTVNVGLAERWRDYLDWRDGSRRKRVGIAWSIGKPSDGDYPREIPLEQLVAALGDAEIHSVQTQGADAARALGVHTYEFADFADCAALMLQMDAIVSVDTAALHLAGAIGHPKVFGLLSHWSSWRWLARWYDNMTPCRQAAPNDWSSALAQIQQR